MILVLFLAAVAGVPVAKRIRTWRRRRATGSDGVVAAWAEARDLLRSHVVRVTSGMTVRDVAAACLLLNGPPVAEHLAVLAVLMDSTLWSGARTQAGAVEAAWAAVALIRRALAGRPVRRRLGAAFHPTSLRPPRQTPVPV
ncbi:hypothetical protein [Fodinicola feengrottensis]|uniref:hypothetical protein n=1 Tax=Fodinicola feengrottensis TaxID=435914 RepID=UPI0024414BFF|nr:hypothetical protein [Fodinicola feengrottensis]